MGFRIEAGRHLRAAWRGIRLGVALLALGCATGRMHSVDNLMRDYTGNAPGASVLVVRDGKVLMQKSYGMADLEQRIATTPDTNYRLASVTKQFTAASILILAKDKKLSIDDPITKYLPLPAYANAITIRHLL